MFKTFLRRDVRERKISAERDNLISVMSIQNRGKDRSAVRTVDSRGGSAQEGGRGKGKWKG